MFFEITFNKVCSSQLRDGQLSGLFNNLSIFAQNSGFIGFILQFHWFLIVLSLRPGMNYEIADHFLPKALTQRARSQYSCIYQCDLVTPSRRWLCHLSRHCLPERLGRKLAISAQCTGPLSCTFCFSKSSSSFVHTLFLYLLKESWVFLSLVESCLVLNQNFCFGGVSVISILGLVSALTSAQILT